MYLVLIDIAVAAGGGSADAAGCIWWLHQGDASTIPLATHVYFKGAAEMKGASQADAYPEIAHLMSKFPAKPGMAISQTRTSQNSCEFAMRCVAPTHCLAAASRCQESRPPGSTGAWQPGPCFSARGFTRAAGLRRAAGEGLVASFQWRDQDRGKWRSANSLRRDPPERRTQHAQPVLTCND